jgi:hypothetical protein
MPDANLEVLKSEELLEFVQHFSNYVSLPAAQPSWSRLQLFVVRPTDASHGRRNPDQVHVTFCLQDAIDVPDWIQGLSRQEVLTVCEALLAQVRRMSLFVVHLRERYNTFKYRMSQYHL